MTRDALAGDGGVRGRVEVETIRRTRSNVTGSLACRERLQVRALSQPADYALE
jgi:hypothetical protein